MWPSSSSQVTSFAKIDRNSFNFRMVNTFMQFDKRKINNHTDNDTFLYRQTKLPVCRSGKE